MQCFICDNIKVGAWFFDEWKYECLSITFGGFFICYRLSGLFMLLMLPFCFKKIGEYF